MAEIDLSRISACVDDAKLAWLDLDPGPPEPAQFADLIARLVLSREKLPPLYRSAAADPFIASLQMLGADRFAELLARDPQRQRTAGLLLDIAQAILQNGEGYESKATDAFQEVISDLYDGFLSAEDRRGVKPPDHEKIAPLVKWGNPLYGPYTWPVDATKVFGLEVAIVSLPPANVRRGLCAYAALGHETGGHDILHADEGLLQEVSHRVHDGVVAAKLGVDLADYWASRIDETASDVLGVLNMGPAAAVGLIAYFRGVRAAFGEEPVLSSVGDADDPHPADVVRGYLAAETVRLLEFSDAAPWAEALTAETDRDAKTIRLGEKELTHAQARQSASIVAGVVAAGRLTALDGHAFSEIQTWRDSDEAIAKQIMRSLVTDEGLPPAYAGSTYAAHVVASAVMAALGKDAAIPAIFGRMQTVLKAMHDANPSWGPLYVVHPGDIVRSYAVAELKAASKLL